ncbi:MAG: DUF488 domain-containing protein [Selenomonadaceae bacterium]|nr:DUF488 domain-containing protein [Selenomonadaceae bacterium]MBQ6759771.1 DUF488 domain-containing protein [Selenomonadaceae bacterium]MBR0103106.1 DUF488 domain-containing protein [Selenomonadaceae bacterium]
MRKIFTIGFTKLTAEEFFTCLERSRVNRVVDVRLYNTSQLLGFSKFPDIKYFLRNLSGIDYVHDLQFAPTERIFDSYKKKYITWEDYEEAFAALMRSRNIEDYIRKNYADAEDYCLLCAEVSPENCHRRLVAEKIKEVLGDVEIVHL